MKKIFLRLRDILTGQKVRKLLRRVKTGNHRDIYLFNKKIFSYEKDLASKMKLGISYNLYDGEELLEPSIKSVRSEAYHINVIYQLVSNMGEVRSVKIEKKLQNLKERHLIDDYVLYDTDLKLKANSNEREKRLLGLKIARQAGCSHFMSMDVDEFYHAQEIRKAKEFILEKKIEVSAVSIIEYVKKPEYQLVCNYMFSPTGGENYTFYVPFICKIKVPHKAQSNKFFPCLVDPTRRMNGYGRFYLFPKHEIAMHHMSTVRADLGQKFRNSTVVSVGNDKDVKTFLRAKKAVHSFSFDKKQKLPKGYSFIGTYPVKKVKNVFNIKFKGRTHD